MLKLVVSNQRGGVGKTTTVLTLSRAMADTGKKVLIVDTDPQGSVWMALGLKPVAFLHQLVNDQHAIGSVVTPAYDKIDIICSDRRTMGIEGVLSGTVAREMIFYTLLKMAEETYDALLFDVAPSITHLQSCAIAYAQNVLIPVAMDTLSIQGARSSLQSIEVLNQFFHLNCRAVGFLPTMVDFRLSATDVVLHNLKAMSSEMHVPVIQHIRTDQAVNRSLRAGKFLQDFDPKAKALEDYIAACEQIHEIVENRNGQKKAAGRE
jgi:chromosome partitioning protein